MKQLWIASVVVVVVVGCGNASTGSNPGADTSRDATAPVDTGAGTSRGSSSASSAGVPLDASTGASSSGGSSGSSSGDSSLASSSGSSADGSSLGSSSSAISSGSSSSDLGFADAGVDGATPDAGGTRVDGGKVPGGGAAVWTNRYDNSRTGATLTETILTPANVAGGKFGLLFSLPVDGTIQAQPLYVPGVALASGTHNVIVVGTEADSVYAFDADTGTSLWHQSVGTPYTVANADGTNPMFGCSDIFPVIGINATPVIDTASNTIYVLAKTSQGGTPHQFLHALDLTTGADRAGSPVEIKATAAGSGDGSVNGQITFDPRIELPRPGLLLDNGVVYLAWAGHCDVKPWHGWVMAYDAKTLAQRGAYLDTPNGNGGGIWQSGIGLSADSTGVYFVAGNGDFDGTGANGNGTNKGLSVGRLTLGAAGLTEVDSYTPSTAAALNVGDNDLTTAAVIGPGTNYLYMAGKDSNLRVLNRGNLGGFHAGGDQIAQNLYMGGGHVHGGPVFWSGSKPTLFVWNEGHQLKGYPILSGGQLGTNASSTTALGYNPPHPGAIVTVSSNGTTPATGIVWASTLTQAVSGTYDAAWHHIVPGELYAFNAEDVSKMLWNSAQSGADDLGLFAKFCPPVVVNGKVYVGTATTTNAVRVYGLKP